MSILLKGAAEQALEVLEDVPYMPNKDDYSRLEKTTALLRQALEQPAQEPTVSKYNEKQIAYELERTAMGDGYYGSALYVAMDMPQSTKADKEMLHRYMHGLHTKTDHVKLQDLAMRIYTTLESEQPLYTTLTKEKNMEQLELDFGDQYASDGSTASYYVLPNGAAELQDLISYKNMNAQIGEIFRACFRYGECSHSDKLRDARKILFYAQAEVQRLERGGK